MSLEIIHGRSKNIIATRELSENLKLLIADGTLYIGYPILASVDDSITIDALLVAEEIGLVVFHVPNQNEAKITEELLDKIQDIQDSLYYAVENSLGRHPGLRNRRQLSVKINIISYLPDIQDFESREDILIATKATLRELPESVAQSMLKSF